VKDVDTVRKKMVRNGHKQLFIFSDQNLSSVSSQKQGKIYFTKDECIYYENNQIKIQDCTL
jgi:hypothetical protein